jgi:hypothetical protein
VTVDDEGKVSPGVWTMGTTAGQTTLTLESPQFPAFRQPIITLDVLPGPASQLTVEGSLDENQWLPTGTALGPVQFLVQDRFNNPILGTPVSFTASGGGTANPLTTTTDGTGRATLTQWKLGPTPGDQGLTVNSGAVSLGRTVHTHTGRILARIAGDSQPVKVATVAPVAPSVRLTDSLGTPVVGVPVVFSLHRAATNDDGNLLSPAEVLTDASGIAAYPGWSVGTNVARLSFLRATVNGLPPTVFTALLQPDVPDTLAVQSPPDESGTAGTSLVDRAAVRVMDRFSNGIPGVAVAWQSNGVGTFQAPALTDSLGFCRATINLPTTAGSVVQLTAQSPALPGRTAHFSYLAVPGAPASIEVADGDGQTGTVRRPLPVSPRVRVRDQFGNGVTRPHVTFQVVSGGGRVSLTEAFGNASGEADVGWTLGTLPGSQTMKVTVFGTALTQLFTATAVAAPVASLTAIAGSGQSAAAGAIAPVPLAVQLRDQDGFGAAGITVNLAVTNGGGTLAGTSVTSDTGGVARVTGWTLGPGANSLSATVASLPGQSATFTATGLPPGSDFNITLNLGGNPTPAVQQAFAGATARWSQVIVGDVPDQPVQVPPGTCFNGQGQLNLVVDDVMVYAFIEPIDGAGGILGGTGGCVFRENGVPLIAIMVLDAADLQAFAQYVPDVVLHELGHAIGVGSAWQAQGLVTGALGATPRFTGQAARLGYWAVLGAPGTLPDGVPLETEGGQGTRDVHWEETTFGAELMTGFVNLPPNPLSLVTTGSLQDLGYQVNSAAADLGYTTAGLRAQAAKAPPIPLREVPWEGPTFDIAPDGTLIPR